jgi:hypothetical protein
MNRTSIDHRARKQGYAMEPEQSMKALDLASSSASPALAPVEQLPHRWNYRQRLRKLNAGQHNRPEPWY